MRRNLSLAGFVFACFILSGCISPPVIGLINADYAVRRVTYATVDGEKLQFDVFWPKGKRPLPMVINFHGGGWSKTDQEMFPEPMCKWLSNRGYVVFNVSYRLAPKYKFPAQVNDALGAVLYIKEHASEYNGDPTRVAVMGDSAGGNLAAMVALCWNDPYFKPTYAGNGKVTAEPQAVVLLFPVLDLINLHSMFGPYVIVEDPKAIAETYIGGPPSTMLDTYKKASPPFLVHKNMPPVMFICGKDDPVLPQSIEFKQKLDELGVPNGFYLATGETHGFTAFAFNKGAVDAYNAAAAFLDLELKYLRPRTWMGKKAGK
ncbi:MAG: alpha/beta hydrolase [Planctomycetes bacterium]|nr:alpha/beta hydrolase [Planctomycetota bacterium]